MLLDIKQLVPLGLQGLLLALCFIFMCKYILKRQLFLLKGFFLACFYSLNNRKTTKLSLLQQAV